MDRMLKVGVATLVVLAGSAMGQDVTTTQPKTAPETTTAQPTTTKDGANASSVVRSGEVKASTSPYWVWNDYTVGLKAVRETAVDSLRLTDEQSKAVNDISHEFRQNYAAFMRTNRAELVELRAKLGDVNTNGDRAEKSLIEVGTVGGVPPKQLEKEIDKAEEVVPSLKQGTPEWTAALERFRAILATAPNAAEYKARIEKVLTPAQVEAVQKRSEQAFKTRQDRVAEKAQAIAKLDNIVANYNINNPAIPEHIRQRWTTADTATRFKMMRGIEQRLKANKGKWEKDGDDSHSQANVPTQTTDPR